MPDRAAAPAAAEGADAAFEEWLAERADFAATSLLGLTLRPTFDAGWDAALAARVASPREDAPLLLACVERVEAWLSPQVMPAEVYVALGVVLDAARAAARGDGEGRGDG
jgi:hypothetical protein